MESIKRVVPLTDLGTGEPLAPSEIRDLEAYARLCNLDIEHGHVALMYGSPQITLAGHIYHANRLRVPYQLQSRQLDDKERKAHNVGTADQAWTAEVKVPGQSKTYTGIGIVPAHELIAFGPRETAGLMFPVVGAHPWQLAKGRAILLAISQAFPIGEIHQVEEG